MTQETDIGAGWIDYTDAPEKWHDGRYLDALVCGYPTRVVKNITWQSGVIIDGEKINAFLAPDGQTFHMEDESLVALREPDVRAMAQETDIVGEIDFEAIAERLDDLDEALDFEIDVDEYDMDAIKEAISALRQSRETITRLSKALAESERVKAEIKSLDTDRDGFYELESPDFCDDLGSVLDQSSREEVHEVGCVKNMPNHFAAFVNGKWVIFESDKAARQALKGGEG